MPLRSRRGNVPWSALGLALLVSSPLVVIAQEAATLPAPATPQPTVPPASIDPAVAAPAATASAADYEARIQQLEAVVRQMQAQMAAGVGVSRDPGTAVGGVGAPVGVPGASGITPSASGRDPGTAAGAPGADLGQPGAGNATPSRSGGASAPGQSFPPNPPPSNRFQAPATLANLPGSVKFGPGFEIKTDDNEFFLQFHDLTQFDYRGYGQGGQNPVHDTFVMPRQWFMASGRITRPIGYFLSLQHATDTVSMLDCFVDLNYDPRIQGRIGRFKTPFTYEFLVEPVQGLITPERSLFFNNFGQNRDLGAMAYGRLFEGYIDYAAGVFNGSRNGYVATQDSKFFSGFVNFKPFKDSEGSFLENLNVGGSVFTGDANHVPVPAQLRTAVPTSGNGVLGVPFLTYNSSAREIGNQTMWDAHAAYFYKSLAIIAEYGGGAQDYSLTTNPSLRTRLPVNSFYVQFGYLLTGETRSSVGIVKPNQPFDLRKGQFGMGAWELAFRYDYLDIGNQVFTSGLSDPNGSANRVNMTDVGFNWHMTQYLKLYFDWQHADFNNPVIFAPGRRQLTSDMFLVRFQLYF